MKFPGDIYLKLIEKNVLNRVVASKMVLSATVLVFVAFLINYLGFGNHANQYRFLFVLSVEALFLFFVVFGKKIGRNPQLGFLAVALICGSLLSISEPKSYVSWDEGIHYKNAEGLKSSLVGGYSRPKSVRSSYSLDQQSNINDEVDGNYKKTRTNFFDGLFSFSIYNKLGYLPSTLALIVGELLHLPHHVDFVFGRLADLLAYSIVVYFAIRKLKTGKMLMAVVALFPTSIFLASNYNYDSWVTAFTMLGLAYLFTELQEPEKKITKKNAIIMLGAFVIGLGPKAIYFPLMALLFLLKKEKFETLKQYENFIWASVFSILFVVGSFMLPFVVGGPGKGDHRGGEAVNSAKQVQFILSDPIAYGKILFNFIGGYINPLNAGGFVTFFAYLGNVKGFYVVLIVTIVVALTDKNKFDKKTDGLRMKAFVFAIFLATVALISTALYVAFTGVKNTTIDGVQPRYLIPLVFPLLFVLGSSRIKNPFNKNVYNLIIFAIMAFVILQGIWDLIVRMYY